MFESISEQNSLHDPAPSFPPASMARRSVKKVSIAENLNCDYSDDNVSDLGEHEDNTKEDVNVDEHKDRKKWLRNLILEISLVVIFVFVSFIYRHKKGCYFIIGVILMSNLLICISS